MKNLYPYDQDCKKIHKLAVERKRDLELKTRLEAISSVIDGKYEMYSQQFKLNRLDQINVDENFKEHKIDLLQLYDFNSKTVKQLRDDIKNLQPRTIQSTCQNCTVQMANSLDHILPQSSFPEYVVNPLNLIPSCTKCNGHKSNSLINQKQKFLNLYLDILPTTQFLFVRTFTDEYGEFNFNYFLKYNTQIPLNIYNLIESHFKNLDLLKRFKEAAIEQISSMEIEIENFLSLLTLDEIKEQKLNGIIKEKEYYGYNHWKIVLKTKLLNDQLFLSRFE